MFFFFVKKGDVVVQLRSPFLPLVTKLTGKTVQMVNIISGSHHHFKGWDQFTAGCAVPRCTKEPERQRAQTEINPPSLYLDAIKEQTKMH